MSLLVLLACTKAPEADSVDSLPHEQGDDTEAPPPVLGCIVGVARDDDNIGEAKAPVQAWGPGECPLLAETEADLGGAFCLDGVRVGSVELQVGYAEGRCAWVHGHTLKVAREGDCTEPADCVDLGILFECYADPAVCGVEP